MGRTTDAVRRRLHQSVLAAPTVLMGLATPASAQPVTERTPNVEGAWVTSTRNLHFTFSHRFEVAGQDADIADIFGDGTIVNYPTFALTYGILDGLNVGFRYSSRSTIAGGPNEWQPYLKWSPVRVRGDGRVALSPAGAWNGAAESVDGELNAQARIGRLGLLGALRGFSAAFDQADETTDAAVALGGGALFRLTRHLSLAADVADVLAGPAGDPAWSAGLQVGIPNTPHTLSILATNVTSGTIQGVSRGVSEALYWGFEFTIPFSGFARWGRIFDPVASDAPSDRPATDAAGRAIVEIDISGISFGGGQMRVPVGTTVRWVNRDPVGHTVTPDGAQWGSALIGPGEVFEHTFMTPGEHTYHCIPHPHMRSMIVVTEAAELP